jgi:hypothetical protein
LIMKKSTCLWQTATPYCDGITDAARAIFT